MKNGLNFKEPKVKNTEKQEKDWNRFSQHHHRVGPSFRKSREKRKKIF
jgi:hypothetical protein